MAGSGSGSGSRAAVVLGAGAAAVAVLVLVYAVGAPLDVVLGVGAGALCLLWLMVLVTVPWNLYFRARSVVHEVGVSREKGLDVPAGREAEAAGIARRMLVAAVAGHLLSAGVLAVVTAVSGRLVGYWFVGFMLLSTLVRPSGAYFAALRGRLSVLMREARFPRDDVLAVGVRADALERGMAVLEGKAEEQYRALAELRGTVDALGVAQEAAARSTDRRLSDIAREFESAVDRLTDNQEIISGVKAFLRLLRAEQGRA